MTAGRARVVSDVGLHKEAWFAHAISFASRSGGAFDAGLAWDADPDRSCRISCVIRVSMKCARSNVRSSRIPVALSGLRPREREKGMSLRERGRRKETERERERGIRNWTERV